MLQEGERLDILTAFVQEAAEEIERNDERGSQEPHRDEYEHQQPHPQPHPGFGCESIPEPRSMSPPPLAAARLGGDGPMNPVIHPLYSLLDQESSPLAARTGGADRGQDPLPRRSRRRLPTPPRIKEPYGPLSRQSLPEALEGVTPPSTPPLPKDLGAGTERLSKYRQGDSESWVHDLFINHK